MNSCWSPVFWCNNGGTLLSHPTPSPIPPYIASCLSILWVPVEVPYFDVIMVELCYLTPPPPLAPYIASHLCQFCELLLKSVFWCYNGITLLSPFRPTSYLCQYYEFPYFDILQKFALTPTPPPLRLTLPHCCVSFIKLNVTCYRIYNNYTTLLF